MKKFVKLNKNGNYWFLFIVAVFVFFVKNYYFHYIVYNEFLFSSICTKPLLFWSLYLPKFSIAIIFSAFYFLIPRRYGLCIVMFVIDLWIESNLIYYRINQMFIDYNALLMIDNMNGFWSSVIPYIQIKDCVFIGTTLIYTTLNVLIDSDRYCNVKCYLLVTIIGFLTHVVIQLINVPIFDEFSNLTLPFTQKKLNEQGKLSVYSGGYLVKANSISHLLFWDIWDLISIERNSPVELTNIDKCKIKHFLNKKDNVNYPKKLVIVIVESFESWVLNNEYMPNLSTILKNENVLYCPNVKSEAKQGTSADGQMIINTGLLPISSGATCYKFQNNVFPSLTSLYKNHNIIVLPHGTEVWNQDEMNYSYCIDSALVCNSNDSVLFNNIKNLYFDDFENIMLITMSTHTPFNYYNDIGRISHNTNMPTTMYDYINSFCCFDDKINMFINDVITDSVYNDATVVITGDHKIFNNEMVDEFQHFYDGQNTDISVRPYCPLIIYSPDIKGPVIIEDVCYQMDIYPTILNLIGCEDYYWKGFGVNLLDSVARKNRPITEDEAFELSDKIIRADYFRTYLDSLHNY